MTIIDLTTRRPAVCFQLEKINQMTAIAARNLVSDLSIFDWYAGARIANIDGVKSRTTVMAFVKESKIHRLILQRVPID